MSKREYTEGEIRQMRIDMLIMAIDEFLDESHMLRHLNHYLYFKKDLERRTKENGDIKAI